MDSITKAKNHPAEIRRTLHLAIPVIIGQTAVFSMNFVDTVMAGRLPEKEVALAALGIGGAIWSSMLMFVLGTLMVANSSLGPLAKRWGHPCPRDSATSPLTVRAAHRVRC